MVEHVCGNTEMKTLALANEIINAAYATAILIENFDDFAICRVVVFH